ATTFTVNSVGNFHAFHTYCDQAKYNVLVKVTDTSDGESKFAGIPVYVGQINLTGFESITEVPPPADFAAKIRNRAFVNGKLYQADVDGDDKIYVEVSDDKDATFHD